MKLHAALLLTLLTACARPELQVELTTDKTVYRSGEPIEVTVKVSNHSHDTALQFASSQRYDFQVIDPTGATQWTWSADRSFLQVLGSEGLRNGQSIEYREQIPAQLTPGKYQVTGMITTMGRPLQASATITVE